MMSQAKHQSRAGATLIELLVVGLIVAILGVGLSISISQTLTIEQNYREEAGVRTALANQLAFLERYLSLADLVLTDSAGSDGVTNAFQATYPRETGGVAWETDMLWIGVTQLLARVEERYSPISETTNSSIFLEVGVTDPDLEPPWTNTFFMADGVLYSARANVKALRLEGSGSSRRLIIEAEYRSRSLERPVGRKRVYLTESITVSRPVRIWNQP
jgi:Tfp pilus assembly protein PilE